MRAKAKIVLMLSFFDDDPRLLRRAVSSAIASGATHVLAVDGPYANFPHTHARTTSPPQCRRAIEGYVPVTFPLRPSAVWEGDEVEKRKFMLARALEIAGPRDWLMICDSDYEWAANPELLHQELEHATEDVATVNYTENPGPEASWSPARLLLRASPDLTMALNHYTYIHPSGLTSDVLCRHSTEPAADLRDIASVLHHNHERPLARAAAQTAYYEARDTQGLEVP